MDPLAYQMLRKKIQQQKDDLAHTLQWSDPFKTYYT